MILIVSHTNADFDALASMVAASLLYPGAVMSLPGGADRNVREFLVLHGEVINLLPPQDIPLDQVSRLIIVETQHVNRLGRFAALVGRPDVDILLYDHHTPQQPTVQAREAIIQPYGANTTLMVEELRRHDVAIDPLYATLFALGIYEDTGSLTFSSTTPEDVDTVAWLLRQGANLDLVATFMNRALSEGQRHILNQLLTNATLQRVHGIDVLVSAADTDKMVDELALLANKMRDVENCDALVLLLQMHDSVLLVARSNTDAVNVAELARRFGGGGHARAASATIHDATVEQVRADVLASLEHVVTPRITAASLMSYPVRTVTSDTSIDDAAKLMLRYGQSGVIVVDDGRVIGVISRRDVDRARHHGFGHAPVRGYMARDVITVTPQTTLPEIERLMIAHDVGRLPVLAGEELLGIVTRTDVLRALHGERYAAHQTLYRATGPTRNLWRLYTERIPTEQRALLQLVAEAATRQGVTIFLVGGAVRDLMLGNENIDFDILVEGEGIPLAETVSGLLGGRMTPHQKFHTGKVELPDGRHLDFATARTEFYQYPAALPTAEHSTVREDLYRRDFTINAMAMQLNGDEPGRVLDPFGGSHDLADGAIRILHTLSFVEDPTRMLRAVRFEARFGFRMEPRTEELARHAIKMELLDRVSGDRLRAEFVHLCERPYPEVGLRRMDELGLLAALEPTWQFSGPAPEYGRMEEALAWAHGEPSVAAHLLEDSHQRLLLIFARLTEDAACRLSARLRLRQKEMALARRIPLLPTLLPRLAQDDLPPSALDVLLHDVPIPAALVLLALCDDTVCWQRVTQYLTTWRLHAALVTGDDLKQLGVPRGPEYGRIMRTLRAARLDGLITTRNEALDLARRLAIDGGSEVQQ